MKPTVLITVVTFAVAFSGTALAQQQSGTQQTDTSRVSGTIDSYRIVALEGEPDGHLIVRITPKRSATGEDTFSYIDLGPARQLKGQNLRFDRDQEIVAIGYLGQFQGVPILVAERIDLDGQRYALQQPGQQQTAQPQRDQFRQDRSRQFRQQDFQRRQSQQPRFERRDMQRHRDTGRLGFQQRDRQQRAYQRQEQDPAVHLVRGEVEAIKDFSIRGAQDDHRLIKISDAEQPDRTWIVNLGEKGKLEKLDLQEGDRVMVQGRTARIDGKPVIRATQLAEVVTLDEDLNRFQEQQSRSARRGDTRR